MIKNLEKKLRKREGEGREEERKRKKRERKERGKAGRKKHSPKQWLHYQKTFLQKFM